VVDVDEERDPLVASSIEIDFPDPLTVLDQVFALGKVSFPEPGEYRVQLFAAGQLLRET